MVLDDIDKNVYVIRNSLIDYGGPVLRIPKSREYYVSEDDIVHHKTGMGEFKYYGPNEFMWLVNENFWNTIKPLVPNTWYLLPQAYSITLIPE